MSEAFHWPEFLPAFSREAENRGFTRETLAEPAAGPLLAWERPANGPRVYLSAGIHGDETAGPLALLELLRSGFFRPDFHWLVCPALNPDGIATGSRGNASGIDLNRDYIQLQSPEIKAHRAWIESRPAPALFLSFHEDWESSGFYFYEINLRDDQCERARAILAAVSPWFAPEPGPVIDGHTTRGPGWIHHPPEADVPEGWPEAILLAKYGCPLSFTFETPSHAPLASRVAAHVAAANAVADFEGFPWNPTAPQPS
jgi:hypothetical protein